MGKVKERVLVVILVLVTYLAGCYFPLKNLMPILKANGPEVTKYEYYTFAVNCISAIFTLLTVVVALFKEEIIGFWKKPVLFVDTEKDLLFENLVEDDQSLAAESYDVAFDLINKGRNDAKNVKIIITDITFINYQSHGKCSIPISDKEVLLDNKDSQNLSIFYPIKIKLASLKNGQNLSVSENKNKDKTPLLIIGSNEIPEEYYCGEIKISFRISCDGGYIVTRMVNFKWDRIWKDRKADIAPKHLNIEFEGEKKNG